MFPEIVEAAQVQEYFCLVPNCKGCGAFKEKVVAVFSNAGAGWAVRGVDDDLAVLTLVLSLSSCTSQVKIFTLLGARECQMILESVCEHVSCMEEYVARVLKGWPSNITLESGCALG
jgi:hypothetical protein